MDPKIFGAAVVMLGLLAQGAAAADDAADRAKLARLREEVAALIGPATCSNLVNCRVAALGVDACGNPLEYVAYSWLSTEKDALETKVAEYNFLQEDVQRKSGSLPPCADRPQPVPACVNRRCVIKP
ncbi:MAG TPA: hypothetical protein VFV71_12190 [Burkholderiales bacterium]|nr:hypothetical protein [Burkholderiales bacterium]